MTALLSPVFTPDLKHQWGVDNVRLTVYSGSVHPGTLDNHGIHDRIESFIANNPNADGIRRGRMGRGGPFYLFHAEDHIRHYQLTGPGSYVLLSSFSGVRRTRAILEDAGSLATIIPLVTSPPGNVISPIHLLDGIQPEDIPDMVQSEVAQTILELPRVYRRNLRDILGVRRAVAIDTSITGAEISWDIASEDPAGLVRSFARPVRRNLQDRPRPTEGGPGSIVPIYAVVGDAPKFRFIAYEKLPARQGVLGVARFEFRFHKDHIRKLLGRRVLPIDAWGIQDALGKLAAHAWQFLLAFEEDRRAPSTSITFETIWNELGGLRNRRQVLEVFRALRADGKVPVAKYRRLLKRMGLLGWTRKLLFRRPAFRKLDAHYDVSGLFQTEGDATQEPSNLIHTAPGRDEEPGS